MTIICGSTTTIDFWKATGTASRVIRSGVTIETVLKFPPLAKGDISEIPNTVKS
jgi:hypothetical protein